MLWLWMLLCVVCIALYIVGYILLRTSGDGRPWRERLRHPSKGGLQEEYGGTGHDRESNRPAVKQRNGTSA